jgi:hypothetical protein
VATGSLAKAQMLSALAADVATGRNLELSVVSKMLEKAAAGNTAMLKRQMPWLDLNKNGTITYAEAIKGLTARYKGAAKAAANRDPWKRIQVVWQQMKEALGQFILPLLQKLGDWFKDKKNRKGLEEWIAKVGEWSRSIGEKLLGKLQEFIGWLQSGAGQTAIANFTNSLKTIADAFGKIAGALDTLGGAWGKVSGFWQKIENMQNGRAPWQDVKPAMPKGPASLYERMNPGASQRGTPTVNVTVHNADPKQQAKTVAEALRFAKYNRAA